MRHDKLRTGKAVRDRTGEDEAGCVTLYRCDQLHSWLSLEQCEVNRKRQAKSKQKVIIIGILSCRGCPGIPGLLNVLTKQVRRETRAGPFPKKGGPRKPSARSVLQGTMKRRLVQRDADMDPPE
jgi:hypothetical protein